MEIISSLSVFVWGWLILAVVMILVEGLTVSLVSIWFAAGGLAASVIAYFTDNFIIQLLFFLVISMILVILTRPLARKKLNSRVEKTNAEALIGREAVVVKEIIPLGFGEVKADGKVWTAVAENSAQGFAEGEIVRIKAIEGVKLVVE